MANYPKIIVLAEKLRGKTFEISKAETSIGSHDNNDVCIDDSSVSDHHANIFRREVDGKTVYVLRDNNSLNGTRVNDVAITGEQVLENSGIILFGDMEVLFDTGESFKPETDIREPFVIAGFFNYWPQAQTETDVGGEPTIKRNIWKYLRKIVLRK